MLQVESNAVAVPRPSSKHSTIIMNEDRKRSASDQDESISLPPAKKRVATVNGDDHQDGNMVTFGASGSPWAVDLATVQKDAILRQMKDYKREKQYLEQQLGDYESRAKSADARVLAIDSWIQQLADELKILTGGLPSISSTISATTNDNTKSENGSLDSFKSQLLKSDTSIFKTALNSRMEELKIVFTNIISRIPKAEPDILTLQNKLSSLVAKEKEYLHSLELTRSSLDQIKEQRDDYQYKWGIARTQLFKAQSQTKAFLELQTKSLHTKTESATVETINGDKSNGVKEVVVANDELDSAVKAAEAEVVKRKEQIEVLEKENLQISTDLTKAKVKLSNLGNEEYSKTELFKTLKFNHEDVIRRINNLEALNKELREHAAKMDQERTAFKTMVEEECHTTCSEMENKLGRLEEDVQRLRSERDSAHQVKTTLESTQSKHDESLTAMKLLGEGNEERIKGLESEIERLKIQLGDKMPSANVSSLLPEDCPESVRKEYTKLQSQYNALNQELESMQGAVVKFRSLATAKSKSITDLEAEAVRLRESKNRLELSRFNERQVVDTKKTETENIRKQLGKSAEIISQLKETDTKSRELCANLEKQLAEYKDQVSVLGDVNRSLEAKLVQAKLSNDNLQRQSEEISKSLLLKDTILSQATHLQRNAEVELAGLKSKLNDSKKKIEEWKSKTKSDPSEEVDMLRKVAYCNTCNSNLKDTLIKNCGHILCNNCAQNRIANRQRKCPVCMKAFGANDLLQVHLV